MMKHMFRTWIIFVLALCALAAMPSQAFAACANPTGDEGDVIYNDDYNVMQFCNATSWISMGGGGGASVTGTDKQMQFNDGGTTLAGAAQVLWDKTNNRMTVGSTTASAIAGVTVDIVGKTTTGNVLMKPVSGAAAPATGGGGSGSTGFQSLTNTQRNALSATAGMMIYNTSSNRPEFYNGSAWVAFGTGSVMGSGASAGSPALSCLDILSNGYSTGNGTYWLDPDGSGTDTAYQAYCDMTTDGGGWTLIVSFTGGSGAPTTNATVAANSGKFLQTSRYTVLNASATEYLFYLSKVGTEYYKTPKSFASAANCQSMSTAQPGSAYDWAWNDPGCNLTGGDYSAIHYTSGGLSMLASGGVNGSYSTTGASGSYTTVTAGVGRTQSLTWATDYILGFLR